MLSIVNSSNPLFIQHPDEFKAAPLLASPPAESIPLEAWLPGSAYHDPLGHRSSGFLNQIQYWKFSRRLREEADSLVLGGLQIDRAG